MQNNKKNKFIHSRRLNDSLDSGTVESGSHLYLFELSRMHQKLDRKEELIEKYQTEIQQLLNHINTQENITSKLHTVQPKSGLISRRDRIQSSVKHQSTKNMDSMEDDPVVDYKKIILGLEYSLETQKRNCQEFQRRNKSLESQVLNLKNLLTKPNSTKDELTEREKYDMNIKTLQQALEQQKKKNEELTDSKHEIISILEQENKILRLKNSNQIDNGLIRKINELTSLVEELRNTIEKKNIKIERLRFSKDDNDGSDNSVSSTDLKKRKQVQHMQKKNKQMSEQLQISNKLIIRKNVEILELSKSKVINEQVVIVFDNLLDKVEIQFPELLSHPVVNKLRALLREKIIFEKELYEKLTGHNKKITILQDELKNKDNKHSGQHSQLINECRELSQLVNALEKKLNATEKNLEEKKNECEILKNDYTIEKKNFVFKMKELSQELNGIINTTQNEFEKQKLQNLKLSEQNKALLVLMGQKEKELFEKSNIIRTLEKYNSNTANGNSRQGNNTANNNYYIPKLETSQMKEDVLKTIESRRQITNISQEPPQVNPTKYLSINSFPNWLIQWNKIRNWANRKALLNILLDKEELRVEGFQSNQNHFISILNQCFFNSKNYEIQERASVIISLFIPKNILSLKTIFLSRIAPYIIRCFRAKNQGEEDEQIKIYNESAINFTNQLELTTQQWNYQMTNEMTSVDGFKYIFGLINSDLNDPVVEKAYNTLTLIARKKEMIPSMIQYNLIDILSKNIRISYRYLPYALYLLEIVLQSDEFYTTFLKSILDYRILFQLLVDNDSEILISIVNCLIKLCGEQQFLKNSNKREALSKIIILFEKIQDIEIQKKLGKLFMIILESFNPQQYQTLCKKELLAILNIVEKSKIDEFKFMRAVKTLLKSLKLITTNREFDLRCFNKIIKLFNDKFLGIVQKTRKKIMEIENLILSRNKEFIEKNYSEEMLLNILNCYNSVTKTNNFEQIIFLLNLLKTICENKEIKKIPQIVKNGKEQLIINLINNGVSTANYTINIMSLKIILAISKQKSTQKYLSQESLLKLIQPLTMQKIEEAQDEKISTILSTLYFISKKVQNSNFLRENNIVEIILAVFPKKYQNENIIYRILALLELYQTTHNKQKVLSVILKEKKLITLKNVNLTLKKTKNKIELATRSIFIYDFLTNQAEIQSLATNIQNYENEWIIEDLVDVRNMYVTILQPLVFKIELLLHQMSKINKTVKKIYETFMVQEESKLSEVRK